MSCNEILAREANIQVTSSTATQARSESVVQVNPRNPLNLICASKKFIDPQAYTSTVSTSYSIDGGAHWTESPLALQPGWDGMTDPDLTFDGLGNVYLIVEPEQYGPDQCITIVGLFVYKSTDGGKSWETPVQVSLDANDDKPWIEADRTAVNPNGVTNGFYGRIYAVWMSTETDSSTDPPTHHPNLRFARSSDQGKTWQGAGTVPAPAGSNVFPSDVDCFCPSLAIDGFGELHVSWHTPRTTQIHYTWSDDGGETWWPVSTAVSGITSLTTTLPSNPWFVCGQDETFPHFPNGTFRVLTLVTSCVAPGTQLIVAWADTREGDARIYYRVRDVPGDVWLGPASGQPLLPDYQGRGMQHFHPQLVVSPHGEVGCAFYEFGPKGGIGSGPKGGAVPFSGSGPKGGIGPLGIWFLIDVLLTHSCDAGASFDTPAVVTEKPWDPAVDAPWSHGDPNTTFIGEYFGLDAFPTAPHREEAFAVVWTDTRTGAQELFFDQVDVQELPVRLTQLEGLVAQILAGVVQDGGGLVLIGGHIIRIPPGDPWIDVLNTLAALDAVGRIQGAGAQQAMSALRGVIGAVAGGPAPVVEPSAVPSATGIGRQRSAVPLLLFVAITVVLLAAVIGEGLLLVMGGR